MDNETLVRWIDQILELLAQQRVAEAVKELLFLRGEVQ